MKKLFALLLPLAIIISCSTSQKKEFMISGKIAGLNEGALILEKRGTDGYIAVDTAYLQDGSFEFVQELQLPEAFYLSAPDHEGRLLFLAGDSDIEIEVNIDDFQNAIITGSIANDQYSEYKKSVADFNSNSDELYEKYKDAKEDDNTLLADSLDKIMDELHDEKGAVLTNYILENNNSYAAPYIATRNLYRYDLAELKKIVKNIDSSLKNYIYVKKLNDRVELLKTVDVGQPAIDFLMEDTVGNLVRLLSYKGKYVLVDFWASWCSPCRKENPNVVAAYHEFKDKGFDILGVSFDKDKEAWLNAIHDDNLTWTHVSELTGWKSSAGKLYGILSIPSNILIDPEGIIIARNLKEVELHDKLTSIFSMQ